MISVSKVPYKRSRIFLNPQLFLSGFKNLHVHTYPVNTTYESVTFLICSGSPEWKFLNTLWIRNRVDAKSGYLTLIGRSWAKYRDLSVASISIICRSRRLSQKNLSVRHWQITIFCDNRYRFNNCFIIRWPSLFFLIIRQKICHFHTRAMARRRKAWIHLRMSRILFAAKHS